MLYYIPKYFHVQELVDSYTFKKYGSTAFQFFNPKLLFTIDQIRSYFGKPMIINNYHIKGKLQWRGLRTKQCTIGAHYSQHRFGNAVDFNIMDIDAEEIRKTILINYNSYQFQYITAMERNTTWVHIDFRNYDKESNGILYFSG